jgi:hypothetical protein
MGVKGEKSSLFWKLMLQADSQKLSVSLTNEEWHRVEQMTFCIGNAVAKTIEGQSYVTQNVLEQTMAKVVAMVLKLNCDMFGQVGGEAEHMAVLIRHAWNEIKDQKIDYGTSEET